MPRAEPKADLAFVRRACHDTLQRGPRPREVRSLVGMPVDRVVRHLAERPEAFLAAWRVRNSPADHGG
ncbi:MAG: hypothetical protein ACO3UM_18880, partial [Planctomycetota bacterium]